TDGIVCGYQFTGLNGPGAGAYNLGRTATHEVGHWLNLRHIWGDGNCNADDFVADTPSSDGPNYGCAVGTVSCSSTDMVQNYMDYSDDACMNLYTVGQKNRMRALFESGGYRSSLLNSQSCGPVVPPTCDDGIQNGDETGIDCGGSNCEPCVCHGVEVTVTLNFDNYPEETSWQISDGSGIVASGGTYPTAPDGSTLTIAECLPEACYTFTIFDSYGDGICCGYGSGSYAVTDEFGNVLASGASFASSEATNFCVSNPTEPTCDDGIQNGDETGIDCGGSCAACPTCNDGIQNGDETGVDCGGSCAACPTCDDGIQNGDETGVDCGGSCAACATCEDGIQNGDETGVDCGGSCTPCGCNGVEVTVTINLDNYPEETSWQITGGSGVVASGGTYPSAPDGSTVTSTECLSDGCYTFTVFDSYGDGLCCSYGSGSYSVEDASGTTYASGASFGSSESTNFCVSSTGPQPTCDDGIQNGDETGVDCGGSCPACATCDDGIQNGDETGVDCGGSCAACAT
ncbi:MAG: M43 family zinc metalloprotease, partial [Flavobacteriales bacterium]